MAIDVDSILGRKSSADRAFKHGRAKPWRLESEDEFVADRRSDIANKQLTNSEQIVNKQLTNGEQTANKQLTKIPDVSLVSSPYSKQIANKQLTNGEQTANKTENIASKTVEEFLHILLRLSNQQKKLFLYIHERCLENGDLASGPIPSDIFASIINSKNNTVRTQLQRLIQRKLLQRLPGKPGRGGFHAYSMTNLVVKAGNEFRRHVFKELPVHQRAPLSDTVNKQLTNSEQTANTIANNAPLSSSSNLIKTTTTSESEISDFLEVDISPLEEIGFTRGHLTQIKNRTQLSTAMIQASINYFAFDLKRNNKADQLKASPLNFFMGILIKQGVPYNPPENYEDETSKALKAFIEKQKALQENLLKLEEEGRGRAFEHWYAQLTEEQKTPLLPQILRGKNISETCKRLSLSGHFIEKEWPSLRVGILNLKNK